MPEGDLRVGGARWVLGADISDFEGAVERIKALLQSQDVAAKAVATSFVRAAEQTNTAQGKVVVATQEANRHLQALHEQVSDRIRRSVLSREQYQIDQIRRRQAEERRLISLELGATEEAKRRLRAIDKAAELEITAVRKQEADRRKTIAQQEARERERIASEQADKVKREAEEERDATRRRRASLAEFVRQRAGGRREGEVPRADIAAGRVEALAAGALPLGAVAAGITAALGLAANAFREFEGVMNGVRAVSNATETEMAALEARALQLGQDTQFSAKQAAEGFFDLAKAGFTVNEQTQAIGGTMDLAAAGQLRVAAAAEISSGVLRGFGLNAAQAGVVADQLAQAVNTSAADMSDLAQTMKFVAPVAKASNQSLQETTGIMAALADQMIKGEQAGTTLRTMLVRLQAPTPESAKKLHELGIAVADVNGKMLPLSDILDQLRAKLAKRTEVERAAALETIFDREALSGVLALLNLAPGRLDDYISKQTEAEGAARRLADGLNKGLNFQLEQLKSSIETVAIKFGKDLAPALTAILSAATGVTNAFAQLPEPLRITIEAIAALGASFADLVAIVGAGVALWPTLVGVFGAIAVAAGAIASPVGLAVVAIVALTGAIVAATTARSRQSEEALRSARAAETDRERLEKLLKRYEELQTKVNRTAKEESERLAIVKQLRDFSPSLVEAYNKEGVAISANTQAVRDEIATLREKQSLRAEEFRAETNIRTANLLRIRTQRDQVTRDLATAREALETLQGQEAPFLGAAGERQRERLAEDAERVPILIAAVKDLEERQSKLNAEYQAETENIKARNKAQRELSGVSEKATKQEETRRRGKVVAPPPAKEKKPEQEALEKIRLAKQAFDLEFEDVTATDKAVKLVGTAMTEINSAVTKGLENNKAVISAKLGAISEIRQAQAKRDIAIARRLVEEEGKTLDDRLAHLRVTLGRPEFKEGSKEAAKARAAIQSEIRQIEKDIKARNERVAEFERRTAELTTGQRISTKEQEFDEVIKTVAQGSAERTRLEQKRADALKNIDEEQAAKARKRRLETEQALTAATIKGLEERKDVHERELSRSLDLEDLNYGERRNRAVGALHAISNTERDIAGQRITFLQKEITEAANIESADQRAAIVAEKEAEIRRVTDAFHNERIDRERDVAFQLAVLAKDEARQTVAATQEVIGALAGIGRALRGEISIEDVIDAVVAAFDKLVDNAERVENAINTALGGIFGQQQQSIAVNAQLAASNQTVALSNQQLAASAAAAAIAMEAQAAASGRVAVAQQGASVAGGQLAGAQSAVTSALGATSTAASTVAPALATTGAGATGAAAGMGTASVAAGGLTLALGPISVVVAGIVVVLGILKFAMDAQAEATRKAMAKTRDALETTKRQVDAAREQFDALRRAADEALAEFRAKLEIRRSVIDLLGLSKREHERRLLEQDQADLAYYDRELDRQDLSLEKKLELWNQHFAKVKSARERIDAEAERGLTKAFFERLKGAKVVPGETVAKIEEERAKIEQRELIGELTPEEAAKQRAELAVRKGAVIQERLTTVGKFLTPEERSQLTDQLNQLAKDFGSSFGEFVKAAPTATEAIARLATVAQEAADKLKANAEALDAATAKDIERARTLAAGTRESIEARKQVVGKVTTARKLGEIEELKTERAGLEARGERLTGEEAITFDRAVEDFQSNLAKQEQDVLSAIEGLGFFDKTAAKAGVAIRKQEGRPIVSGKTLSVAAVAEDLIKEGGRFITAATVRHLGSPEAFAKTLFGIKFAHGGYVPGGGDRDSVSALLTPGELVIPKPFAQIFPAFAATLRSGAAAAERIVNNTQVVSNSVNVSINLGGVVVREEADENRLVAKMQAAFGRRLAEQMA